jgi:hypothetical protein
MGNLHRLLSLILKSDEGEEARRFADTMFKPSRDLRRKIEVLSEAELPALLAHLKRPAASSCTLSATGLRRARWVDYAGAISTL